MKKPFCNFLKPNTLNQFLKYATTGIIAFLIEYSTFYLLQNILGFWYIWSNTIAMVASFSFSFPLNRFWSFKAKGNVLKQFIMYGTLFIINLFASNMAMLLFTDVLKVRPLLSKLIAVGIIVCWNFVIMKKVVFKMPKT